MANNTAKAGRVSRGKTVEPAKNIATTTATNDPNTDPYRDHAGLYVNLHPEYMRNRMGHWSAPAPNGQPRTIKQQFLELEREGIAALYGALNAFVKEQFPFGASILQRASGLHGATWTDMHTEHHTTVQAWAKGNGFDMRNALPYGVTYQVAKHQKCHGVMRPKALSEEEAAHERSDMPGVSIHAGQVVSKLDHSETATAEEVCLNWVRLYTAEVKDLLGTEPNEEHIAGFNSLRHKLSEHGIGAKDGKRVVERLRGEAMGAEVWAAFVRCTTALSDALEQVADDVVSETSATMENATPETSTLLIWKGQPAELFALFEELVGKGWVELPKNRGKRSRDQLARNVHSAFAYASGTTLKVGTAVNYLKKGRDGVNEQRPEPRVPFALKRNPDVGDAYDPDKAGE